MEIVSVKVACCGRKGKYRFLWPFFMFILMNSCVKRDEFSVLKGPYIWFVQRKGEGWAEPESLGPEANTNSSEWYPSPTKSGPLYFSSSREGGYGSADIYVSRFEDGSYLKAENLGFTSVLPLASQAPPPRLLSCSSVRARFVR